jgi:regulator of sigma E protease
MFENILIFVVFLGPLIFFHELGHFLFARFFGVRVETFSIGFGPKLFKYKKGDTDYAVSLIPLGGYVKMFGEDILAKEEMPAEERPFAFNHKTKFQRFWIVFGGPLANFILAFVIYFSLIAFGEKVPEVKVGVLPNTNVLYEKGMRAGDIVKFVNKNEIISVEDFNFPDNIIDHVIVVRGGVETTVRFDQMPAKLFLDEYVKLTPLLRSPYVVDAKNKIFYVSSGNQPQDESLENVMNSNLNLLNLFPVDNVETTFDKIQSQAVPVSFSALNFNTLREKGYYPLDLMVSSIVMGSPAEKAGIQKDDIILTINGTYFESFVDLREFIQQNGEKDEALKVEMLRSGKKVSLQLTPEKKESKEGSFYSIGVYSSLNWMRPKMVESRPKSFVEGVVGGIERTWSGIVSTVAGFHKLLTGGASLKSLGGPLAIGKVAADSFSTSLSYFFRLMAIISINLGILNLFPIPVLDGGHILFIAIETVIRGPVPKKIMILSQQVGLSLLLMLMMVALFNDFSRFF